MPVSVIFEASAEATARAKAAGFVEKTVLVRQESALTEADQDRVTSNVLRLIKPYQYVLTSWWGAGAED